WLDQFKDCFGHRAQRVSLRQYVDGLLGDSARKSMSAMLARVTEPTSYQAFQHFITHAPWHAETLWRRLRRVLPERTGILILDETSFPKQGPHSVGVARQYCGALGKVANCQVAVTAALWTGQRAWPMGALLYLPQEWASDLPRRATVQIPSAVEFHEKWRLALTLVRRTRAAGVTLTAVVADAEYGDNSTVRQTLHRLRLPYALGISPTGRRKHYFVSLPPSASLTQIVRLAHHRWAIEQQYQDLKSELGLDHFEGRTYPGWQHHVVISAVVFAVLQTERRSPRAGLRLTFPQALDLRQAL